MFGSPERLDALALMHNLSTVVALGFVVAVPAAAAGRLLADLVSAAHELPAPRPALRGLLMTAFVGAVVLTALGTEPLIRYGPGHRVYFPAPRSGAAPAGQVVLRVMHSGVLGADRPLAVYLPPSYRLAPDLRYPVVYLLHGSPGSYRDWLNLGIAGISDAGVAAGSMAEAIIVMPDGNGRFNRPTQWADSHDGADRLESATIELVSQIDHEYRTLADRRHRVVAGLSEGGFGAVNLASRHPDLFGAAISLSGYFRAEGVAFGGSPSLMRANSPSSTVRDTPAAQRVRFILVAGESDLQYLRGAEAFAAELDQLRVPHALFRLPGGHESWVWTNGLVLGLVELKPQLGELSR
jgi:enterochelin esterase-like enzyme